MKFMVCVATLAGFFSLSSFAGGNVPDNLKLFCSSGGFLYNYLEISEDHGKVNFYAYGYPWGFIIDKERLEISSDIRISDVKFSVERSNCEFTAGEKPSLQCSLDNATIRFFDEQGNSVEKGISPVTIKATEQKFLIEQAGFPLVVQKLRNCVNSTDLD